MGAIRKIIFNVLVFTSCVTVSSLDVQAHRGGRDLYPENTLAAFAHALDLGVDTLEMDLALTADGIPVLSHDPYLSSKLVRGPDGAFLPEGERILIRTLTRDDLRRFSVGEINRRDRYYYAHRNQQPVPEEQVPDLNEVFDLVDNTGHTDVRFNIEIKTYPDHPELTVLPEEFVDAVLPIIESRGMVARISIQSFDWRTLRIVKERNPDIMTVCLTSERMNLERGERGPSLWLDGFDVDDYSDTAALVAAFGADAVSPDYRDVGREEIGAAHDLGIPVIAWTVNEPAAMRRLISWEIDGIITDRPDILLGLLDFRY